MPQIDIKKYGRHWALFLDEKLLAVVVYKKGAQSIKDHLERALSRNERVPSWDEIEKQPAGFFHDTILTSEGLQLWNLLRASDWQRALRVAAKNTGEDVFAWLAFAKLSAVEKRSFLRQFAYEGLSANTHWPIVSAILSDVVRAPDAFDSSAITDLATAFVRLGASQKAVVGRRIAAILSCHTDDCVMPSLRALAEVLKHETLQAALKHSVGKICFQHSRPKADELNETSAALGCTASFSYQITLDFETEPLSGRPLQKLPWDFSNDGICSNPVAKSQVRTRFQRPNTRPVFDYFGCFFWDGKVGPYLVLRVGRIAASAKGLNVSFESLFIIAWIHQFAHLVHLGIPDADGKFNLPTTPEFAETIAQWATWRTVNAHPFLHDTFVTLTENLCDACYCSDPIRECSTFEMCSYLWCVRNNAEGFDRRSFARKLFNFGNEQSE